MQRLLFFRKKILLILMTSIGIFSYTETFQMNVPKFSHFDMTGYTRYYIELDEKGRIKCIESDDGSGSRHTDMISTYNDGYIYKTTWSNIDNEKREYVINIQQELVDRYQLRVNKKNTSMTNNWNDDIYDFSNGILYVKWSGTDSHRYEFADEGDCYGVSFCENPYKDKKTGLIKYDSFAWEARATLDKVSIHSDDMDINLGNLFVIDGVGRESYFSYLLFPLIICNSPCDYNFNSYESSSHLVENELSYGAENLQKLGNLPWATRKGNGIGELITIKADIRSDLLIEIRNGFLSDSKPYLYKENSRVKRMRISYIERGTFGEFLLKDVSDRQVLDVKDILGNYGEKDGTLVLEILEIYPGSKYNDLCIQSILPCLWRAPLPVDGLDVSHPINHREETDFEITEDNESYVTNLTTSETVMTASSASEMKYTEKTNIRSLIIVISCVSFIGIFIIIFLILRKKGF